MKKLLLLTAIILFSAFQVKAQENGNGSTEKFVYCELVGTQKFMSQNITVALDFGQKTSYWSNKNRKLVDENNKPVVFNSMVDAMNFMGESGWEFAQAYIVTMGQQNVYHWLLKKNISMFTPEEQAEMLNGLNLNK